jgi:hypothetical protein
MSSAVQVCEATSKWGEKETGGGYVPMNERIDKVAVGYRLRRLFHELQLLQGFHRTFDVTYA